MSFITSNGSEIELKGVSQFKMDAVKASQVILPVPTYTIETVTGEKQEFELDEEIANSKGLIGKWTEYKEQQRTESAKYSKLFLELLVWEGTIIEVPGPDSEWQKTCDYFKLKVPENPIERKLFYAYNELLGTPEDIGNLIAEILDLSNVDAEAVATLRKSFRIGVQKQTDSKSSKS